MLRCLCVSSFLCICLFGTVKADPFIILPNGDILFNTSYSTQGTFNCHPSIPCTNSGTNSVTLGAGANTLTLTFTGISDTILVGSAPVPASMGQIQVSTTGSGFIFPSTSNPNISVLIFNLSINQTSPTAGTALVPLGFGPGGGTTLPFFNSFGIGDHISFSAGPNPFSYTHIVYVFERFDIPNTGTVVPVNANVSAVPEPSSLLLLGSLLPILIWRYRCRPS